MLESTAVTTTTNAAVGANRFMMLSSLPISVGQAGLEPHVRSDEDGGIADKRWNLVVRPFDSPVAGATVSVSQSGYREMSPRSCLK